MTSAAPRNTWEQHAQLIAGLLADPLQRCATDAAELLPLDHPNILGRVVAHDVMAIEAVPAFDNSQMDGYALRSSDVQDATPQHPITLPVGVTTAAGDAPQVHVPGTASPIMTGAPLPSGADTVVPIEQSVPPQFPQLYRAGACPEKTHTVSFVSSSEPGHFVRRRGEDRSAGSLVVRAGTRISAALLGSLAATGNPLVPVRRKLRVLLCATGDELLTGAEEAAVGRIYDANTPMLAAALTAEGAEVQTMRTRDDAEAFRAAVRAAAVDHDLIVTMGGISAGAFEVVRTALQHDAMNFGSLALQPGGPQGLGTLSVGAREVPVLCFPGNPVSAYLSAEMFLLPLLREARGRRPHDAQTHVLAHDVHSPADKHQVRRGTLDENGHVHVSAPGSHLISELADAELLVHMPLGVDHVPAGASVLTWRIND